MEGRYSNRYKWVIPKDTPQAAYSRILTYTVGVDGRVRDCLFELAGQTLLDPHPANLAQCPSGLDFAEGYRDSKGQLVERRVRIRQSLEIVAPGKQAPVKTAPVATGRRR